MKKPKTKIIVGIILNFFSIGVIAFALISPVFANTPIKYESRWKIISNRYLEIATHMNDAPGNAYQVSSDRIAIGPAKYEVNYCIGGEFIDDDIAKCNGTALKEIWTATKWKSTEDTEGAHDASVAKIKIVPGNDQTGGLSVYTPGRVGPYGMEETVSYEPIFISPTYFPSSESRYPFCMEHGLIMRSSLYGISFVDLPFGGICNDVKNDVYHKRWSYSELPIEWEVKTQ